MQTRSNLTGVALALAVLLGSVNIGRTDVVVISHSTTATKKLSPKQVAAIFLGKSAKLPDGTRIEVKDLPVTSPTHAEFYQSVVHKTEHQLRAYWAKRTFAGKGSTPAVEPSDDAMVKWVSAKPGRIGYVSADYPIADLTVLLRTEAKN